MLFELNEVIESLSMILAEIRVLYRSVDLKLHKNVAIQIVVILS